MKFIVVGVSGNGKTTLSKKLSEKLNLPHIELDALYHQKGWVETPKDEFLKKVEAAISQKEGWILDGSYISVIGDFALKQADTLVWLDQNLSIVLYRLMKRIVRDIITKRELYNGNRQTVRGALIGKDSLIIFAVRMYFNRRKEWTKLFSTFPNLEVVRLRKGSEVKRWVDTELNFPKTDF